MQTLPPLSLYVHIPWCVRKCPYCDFNSHVSDVIPETLYLQTLLNDLGQDSAFAQNRTIGSVFFGGGTPSLMSPDFYRQLLPALRQKLVFADDIEITLEANPGTFELKRFGGFSESGINRLSLGVQSFDDHMLKALGRIHSSGEARRAVAAARDVGFSNINIDLMHGLPDQTPAMALDDLEQACELGPNHLSWYQLTIEANTEFYSRPPVLPADEQLSTIQQQGQAFLSRQGYTQYEVSAYAQPEHRARHNLNYWQFGDYIGIGAGAHSKITLAEGSIVRYRKSRSPKDYMKPKPHFRVGELHIEESDLAFEFLMNALRLNEGVAEALFTERTGLPMQAIEEPLTGLRAQGLIEADRLQATPLGKQYLDSILERFVTV